MSTRTRFIRLAAVLGLTIAAFAPGALHSAPFGGTFRASIEALGLRPVEMPADPAPGTSVTLTVVNPDRLAARGLTGLKANDQVVLTVLEGNKFTVTRAVPALLVVLDDKMVIQRSELVPLNAMTQLIAPTVELL